MPTLILIGAHSTFSHAIHNKHTNATHTIQNARRVHNSTRFAEELKPGFGLPDVIGNFGALAVACGEATGVPGDRVVDSRVADRERTGGRPGDSETLGTARTDGLGLAFRKFEVCFGSGGGNTRFRTNLRGASRLSSGPVFDSTSSSMETV